ncbi:MAG: hypothetical protein HIU84_14810 [Acidobacteria bacterium]|nr:hypothetical protein [Acidobacteriota bacterium]
MTPRKNPRPKVAYPGSRGPGPGKPVQPPRPTTPKDSASVSLCINAPVFVDLSNVDETRATIALATLLESVLVRTVSGGRPAGAVIEPFDVTASTHG